MSEPRGELRAPVPQRDPSVPQRDLAGRRRVGEVRRMAQPVLDVLGAIIRRAHWPIVLLGVLYLCSGITGVKADEVAVVLRWGRLVGEGRGEQIKQPGLLWAFPRPIDEVVRVKVNKIHEVEIDGLWPPLELGRLTATDAEGQDVIDPLVEGYCLTGDRSILQFLMLARYRVLDPIAYALVQVDPHQLMRDVVQATMVRATGESDVDDLLARSRDELRTEVLLRSQAVLDELGSGLELVSVEFVDLSPPVAVIPAFLEVQQAYTEAATAVWEARQYREQELPAAEAQRRQLLADASIYRTETLAQARGRRLAFENLLVEYELAPQVVRERLWLESVERGLAKLTNKKFVQPPAGETYADDWRITISTRRPQ